MRMVHVCRVAPPGVGGMESVVAGLANAQAAAGWDVSVVTLRESLARTGGVALHPAVQVRGLRRLGPRRYPCALGMRAAVAHADVVHVHGIDGLADQVLTVRTSSTRVGISTHGGYLHTDRQWWLKQGLLRTWTRPSLRRADAVWFTSVSDRHRLAAGLPHGQVVPNGVDIADLSAVPRRPEPGRWVVLGRIDAHKGLPRLLNVLDRLVARSSSPWTLHLVGEEAQDGLVELVVDHAARRGLDDRLRLHGRVDRATLVDHLSRAELALFPSRAEGFGLALVEALAAGVPVLAQSLEAFADKIRAPDEGMLLDFDDVEGAVAALLTWQGGRSAITERAARRAGARWSWEAVLPIWSAAYARLGAHP